MRITNSFAVYSSLPFKTYIHSAFPISSPPISVAFLEILRTICKQYDSTNPSGGYVSQFEKFLKDHRLQYYCYHGGVLLGNQVHRLFGSSTPLYPSLLEVINPKTKFEWIARDRGDNKLVLAPKPATVREDPYVLLPTYEQVKGIFDLFHRAYRLYTAARILTDAEVTMLEGWCPMVASQLHQHFPEESITPKLHMLAVEIPRFARQFRTVGLFTEQNIESFHAQVNQFGRQYAGVASTLHRYELMFQAAILKCSPQIEAYEPPKRVCPQCSLPIAKTDLSYCQCAKPPTRRHSI